MSFLHQNYLWIVLILIVAFIILVIRQENKFFSFVERFWFKKRSFIYLLSRFAFLAGFSLLLMSLLDLRGPEERIKTKIPSKRTIILIDTSASMLAEDVRPSRLEKAVLLAKHFARKAVGHQISVIAFSEIQKKIVPFTADIDLIDSRLESIRGLKNQYGTSALSIAIQEAILSFKSAGEDEKGNILVLTDGEETTEGIDLKIPEGTYIAFVGIGTKNGGRIPLDDKRGMRYGYKSYKGQDVITKLNEEFFQSIVKKHPQAKYWLADTYALPSEDIVAFFDAEFSKGIENKDMVIKPVFMHWLVVPGVLLLLVSYFLKMIKVFALVALIIMNPLYAQDAPSETPIPEKVQKGLAALQKGELSRGQRIGLAYELQKNNLNEEAVKLYKEEKDYLNSEQQFNYATALLSNKEFQEGFSEYKKLLDNPEVTEEVKKKIAQNSLHFLRQQQQDKQKDKDQKNSQEKNQDKNSNDNNQGSSGDQQDQNQSQSGQQEKQDNKDSSGRDQKDQNKKESADTNEQKKDEKNRPEDSQDNKPMPPRKVPAKLKQLMSDDRKLQMEMIERGTRDMNKRKSNSSKDW